MLDKILLNVAILPTVHFALVTLFSACTYFSRIELTTRLLLVSLPHRGFLKVFVLRTFYCDSPAKLLKEMFPLH